MYYIDIIFMQVTPVGKQEKDTIWILVKRQN